MLDRSCRRVALKSNEGSVMPAGTPHLFRTAENNLARGIILCGGQVKVIFF